MKKLKGISDRADGNAFQFFFVFLLILIFQLDLCGQDTASISYPVQQLEHLQYDSALIGFDSLIQNNPGEKELYFNRGLAHYHLKQFDSAAADFNQCLAMDSNFSDAAYMLGLSLGESGKIEAALKVLKTVPQQNKNYNHAQKCIKTYRIAVFISKAWYYMIAMALVVFIMIALVTGLLSTKKI
jgi:tetratricopeptide (TPR) repeat protein